MLSTDTDTDTDSPPGEDPEVELAESTGAGEAPTIELGAITAELEEPPALVCLAVTSTKQELEEGGTIVLYCKGAAAMAMAWPRGRSWPGGGRPRRWRVGQNVVAYGAEIYEELRAATRGDVVRRRLHEQLFVALNWATDNGLTSSEIKEARDFYAALEEAE